MYNSPIARHGPPILGPFPRQGIIIFPSGVAKQPSVVVGSSPMHNTTPSSEIKRSSLCCPIESKINSGVIESTQEKCTRWSERGGDTKKHRSHQTPEAEVITFDGDSVRWHSNNPQRWRLRLSRSIAWYALRSLIRSTIFPSSSPAATLMCAIIVQTAWTNVWNVARLLKWK